MKWPFIVDFPLLKMVIFHCYVTSPESRSDGGLKGFSLSPDLASQRLCRKDALQQIQQHGMEMFNDQASRLQGKNGFLSGLIHSHWSGAKVDQDVCHATLRQFESDESETCEIFWD